MYVDGTSSTVQLVNELNSKYNLELTQEDLTGLIKAVSNLIEKRQIFQNTEAAAWSSESIDYTTDIMKARSNTADALRHVEYETNSIAMKACIKTYTGPLTMDVMKQLSNAGYDATYGSESMKQMYLMYQENMDIKAKNGQYSQELDSYRQKIGNQQNQIAILTERNNNLSETCNSLSKANDNLRQSNKSLNEKITELSQQISSLSSTIKVLPKLIISQLSEVFGKKSVNNTMTEEQIVQNKTL